MGFNAVTLLALPFGLIMPLAIIIYFCVSKKRKQIAVDSAAYGLGGFLASVVAAFVVFIVFNALFLSSVKFDDDASGLKIAGTIISILILILFIVCESFKMMTVNKFLKDEKKNILSGIGYSAGVVLAQNLLVFIALNIFSNYEMNESYAIFSGAFVFVTSIMYTALSVAAEIMLRDGYKYPAYGVSFVYYLYWIAAVLCIRSTVLIYVVTAFFFILSLVLSGVFIIRSKNKTVGNK